MMRRAGGGGCAPVGRFRDAVEGLALLDDVDHGWDPRILGSGWL